MKILIADSDLTSLRLLQKTLIDWGNQVVTATDGLDALAVLQDDHGIELAILDWGLPQFNGIEFGKKLRSRSEKSYLHTIISIGRGDEIGIIEAIEAGVDDYLTKPHNQVELRARLIIASRAVADRRDLLLINEALDEQIRERTLEFIEAKRAAERTTQLKSEFLANMSHEIRTPLNGIISLASLVQSSELDDQQREDIETMQDCAESLRRIIGDILDFSKIEADKLGIDAVKFLLSELTTRTDNIIKTDLRKNQLELLWNIAEDVPSSMIGDPVRIQQVLTNLLANSIKFTPEQGGIIVHVFLESRTETQLRLHFVVADSGVGIPEDKQRLIFEAFTQADGSITRKFGGTGLGLTICAKLAHLMAGRVWLESKPGMGSAFHFVLTLQPSLCEDEGESQKPLAPSDQEGSVATATKSILIVEDDEVNRNTMSRILTKMGYRITMTHDGAQALAALKKDSFDIVLMDLQMPVKDGIETTKCIRADTAGHSSIPIIALTAFAVSDCRERCLEAGVDAFLTKPIDYIQLSAVIEDLTQ